MVDNVEALISGRVVYFDSIFAKKNRNLPDLDHLQCHEHVILPHLIYLQLIGSDRIGREPLEMENKICDAMDKMR